MSGKNGLTAVRRYIPYAVISALSIGYIFSFGTYFFRDFSIIFDGGLRIWHGQVPYRDFYFSTGPVIYYLQGLFDFLFGPSRTAMLAHAIVLNTVTLILFYKYTSKNIGVLVSICLTILLHVFFHARLVNPWYDQTALFFYFIAQITVLTYVDKSEPIPLRYVTLIAFMCFLSIFSRQDTGPLGSLFIMFQMLVFSQRRKLETGLFLLILTLLVFATVSIFSAVSEFSYWFNYGQYPHSSRLGEIPKELLVRTHNPWLKDFRLHAIIFSIGYVIVMKDFSWVTARNLFFIIGFIVFSVVIAVTSGQGKYSSLFFVPLIALYLFKLISENRNSQLNDANKTLVSYLLGWIVLGYMVVHIFINLFPIAITFSERYATLKNSSYAGYRFQPEIIHGIDKLKTELQRGEGRNEGQSNWFLNMSSYTFLYRDLDVEPPRGMHLYYHDGISMFERDYVEFLEKLKERKFTYILLQEMASGSPPYHEFRDYLALLGYRKLFSVDTPKSGVRGTGRGNRYNATLYILLDSS